MFSITIGTLRRERIFDDSDFGVECVERLRRLCSKLGSKVYAYCLMPDHFHQLLSSSESATVPDLIGQWKSLCYQARRRRGRAAPFWQRSYFDRALRDHDDLRVASRYILENPVRAGIVVDFHHYPLCGSMEFDL